MRALSRCEVTVQFRHILENRDTGEGLNDLEDLFDLGLHVDEGSLAAALAELFARSGKDAQTGAADELQFGQIEDQIGDLTGEDRGELTFEVGGSGGVEAAVEFDGGGGGGGLFYVNFEWHTIGICSVFIRFVLECFLI
jgi:hypothetical protein